MLTWTLPGPPGGQVFSAALGTSAAFTNGTGIAYVGLGLSNPVTSQGATPVKLVPLRVCFAGIGTGAGTGAWGVVKITGTAAAGTLSAFSGVITSPGVAGTTTGVAIVTGTFTVLNGTAGPSPHGLNWMEFCGPVGGTATAYTPGNSQVELGGLHTVMPGETFAIAPTAAMQADASIVWLEVKVNQGA